MIKVLRVDAPQWLTRSAQKWTDELQDAIAHYQNGGQKPSEELWDKYNKPYVKKALREMFYDKCAYCESKVPHVAHSHIEHYHPKKKYPQYTFDWQNLLLACGKCNGDYKGDHFPLEEDDENKPLLLNPCKDDPEQHLKFEQARVVSLSTRGDTTVLLLGLNRDELFDRRRALLLDIHILRLGMHKFKQTGDQTMVQLIQKTLDRKMLAEAEYTAMTRQFMVNPLPENPPL